MKTTDRSYYPIFLNICGRRCVVVGGGQVALRKVRMLLEHGAKVLIISPQVCSELNRLGDNREIAVLRRYYQAGDLQGAFIAIAATDDSSINQEVVEEARRGAVLVNVADDAESSDFIVPSYLRRGDLTIAVSTAGRSPALARKIRTILEKEFGHEYASLVLLLDEVRAEAKRLGIKADGDAWQEALDLDSVIDLMKKGDSQKAKAILLGNLRTLQE